MLHLLLNNPYSSFLEILFPLPLILSIISISVLGTIFIFSLLKSEKNFLRYFKGVLSINYILIGFILLLATLYYNSWYNFLGSLVTWIIAILLIRNLKDNKVVRENYETKYIIVISVSLIILSLVIYPMIQILMGSSWSNIILFGFGKCPTTMFLIGILILSPRKNNKFLLVLTSTIGVIVGFQMSIIGFYADFLYMIAGIIGIIFTIKSWNYFEKFI